MKKKSYKNKISYEETKKHNPLHSYDQKIIRWCNKCGCEREVRDDGCRLKCDTCQEWIR